MSTGQLTICLWFKDQGEEAARFYVTMFPNSQILDVARYPSAPGEAIGKAMMVSFELDGRRFQALNGGPMYTLSPAFSLVVPCQDQAEIDHYWSRLGAGGEEARCGWLTDRFGVSWQIVPTRLGELMTSGSADQSRRVNEAMMGMIKFDIAALEAAYAG